MPLQSFFNMTWQQVEDACADIAEQFRGRVQSIFGEPRGGLVPAVIISHALQVPLVTDPDENTLWIDDIIDSGTTVSKASGFTAYVSLCKRPQIEQYAPVIVEQGVWVIFPWESAENAKDDCNEYLSRQ